MCSDPLCVYNPVKYLLSSMCSDRILGREKKSEICMISILKLTKNKTRLDCLIKLSEQ
jgi:hypothetical protein